MVIKKILAKLTGEVNDVSNFSFGATSAITTSLAVISGMDELSSPKMTIIGALLVIAVADNISDSLGIHVYRESETNGKHNSKFNAITNFITRLTITLLFALIILIVPLKYAIILSVILGLTVLSVLSYLIAAYKKTNPYTAILHHVGVAVIVMATSHFIGQAIAGVFKI
ncbi:Uncharacterised protein [uncultured archaeon]|nr:Uncharacterised protein [uncultured archaeon]